jgi:NDP-sugar pyrophosphorylase family protein
MKRPTVVIPCAGNGSRLGMLTKNTPKPMIQINGISLLEYNLNRLASLHFHHIVIVVKESDVIIQKYIGNNYKKMFIEYVYQQTTSGLLNAILQARSAVNEYFLVVLGDEIYIGSDHVGMIDFSYSVKNCGGVCGYISNASWEVIQKNYSIKIDDLNIIHYMEEKPTSYVNDKCGTGSWLLSPIFFQYAINLSHYGCNDVIAVIRNMIHDGYIFYGYDLGGKYVNINTPKDIEIAASMLI